MSKVLPKGEVGLSNNWPCKAAFIVALSHKVIFRTTHSGCWACVLFIEQQVHGTHAAVLLIELWVEQPGC